MTINFLSIPDDVLNKIFYHTDLTGEGLFDFALVSKRFSELALVAQGRSDREQQMLVTRLQLYKQWVSNKEDLKGMTVFIKPNEFSLFFNCKTFEEGEKYLRLFDQLYNTLFNSGVEATFRLSGRSFAKGDKKKERFPCSFELHRKTTKKAATKFKVQGNVIDPLPQHTPTGVQEFQLPQEKGQTKSIKIKNIDYKLIFAMASKLKSIEN